MCGVFGCVFKEESVDISKIVCYGLIGLQHRGQEAAGICVASRDGRIECEKDFGMVGQTFTEAKLKHFRRGNAAIGHVRYSTSGKHDTADAIQPYFSKDGSFAIAFNGTIARPIEITSGTRPSAHCSDVSFITEFLETRIKTHEFTLEQALALFSDTCSGAFSMLVIARNGDVYAMRDRYGYRPLQIASIRYEHQRGILFSSEDCAFQIFDSYGSRAINPGSILKISGGTNFVQVLKTGEHLRDPYLQRCAFELVYFSRPDSHFDGVGVSEFRESIGRKLFQEFKNIFDLEIGLSSYRVCGVPDSSVEMALGFCAESGTTHSLFLTKNRYIHRTFIQPTQEMRNNAVRMKLNIIPEKIRDQRVVIIDDSLIRGTTMRQIIQLVRSAEPREIIVMIACPPVRYSCYFGMDFKARNEMMANVATIDEMCHTIGADRLLFLSLESLQECLGEASRSRYCSACWTGDYNRDIEDLG